MRRTVRHGNLHHAVPDWVPAGCRYHVRIRLEGPQRPLTDPDVGPRLLESACFYHARRRWYGWLLVLMPDHLHAILSFAVDRSMSDAVGDWKRYHTKRLGITWQDNYFDHRLRSDDEFETKCSYVRMNPVRAGLCESPRDWPWVAEPWRKTG